MDTNFPQYFNIGSSAPGIRHGPESSPIRPPMSCAQVRQSLPPPIRPCQQSANPCMVTAIVGTCMSFLARSPWSSDYPVPWCGVVECPPSSFAHGRRRSSPVFCHSQSACHRTLSVSITCIIEKSHCYYRFLISKFCFIFSLSVVLMYKRRRFCLLAIRL